MAPVEHPVAWLRIPLHVLDVVIAHPLYRLLWVIQEVTAASSVLLLWGNTYISWPLIGLASAWILTKGYKHDA